MPHLIVDWRWDLILSHRQEFVDGALLDLRITVLGFAFGCLLGLVVAFMRLSRWRLLSGFAYGYIQVARGIPFYVLLLWVYFGLALVLGLAFSSLQAMVISLAVTGSGYIAEIFRSGIQAVEHGQVEAAASLGMRRFAISRDIVMPQAIRIAIPPLGNTFVGLFKGATIMSVIGVEDIVYQANQITVTYFTPFEAYLTVAAVLVAIVFAMSAAVALLERRLRLP